MKKVLVSLSVIALVAIVAVGATRAYFSDTASITGNTITAGTLDLKVDQDPASDNQVWSDGFDSGMSFANLAPGYNGSQIIDIKNVGSVDGDVSVRLVMTNNAENELLAQESAMGDNAAGNGNENGELAQNLRVKISYSPNNDGVFTEKYDFTLAEFAANPNQLSLGAITSESKIASVKLEWYVPTSVGNNIMTDSVGVNVVFGLEQTPVVVE